MSSVRKLFSRMLGLPMLLGLALLGLSLAVVWPGLGLSLSWLALLLLTLLAMAPVSDWLIARLERQHQPHDLDAVDPPAFIAVLGGDLTRYDGPGATLRLGAGSRARLMYGLELGRRWPGAKLLVSSFPGDRNPQHRRALAEAAEALGFQPRELRVEHPHANTAAEIRALRALIDERPVALVSSAMHIPRVMRLARRHGLNALAAGAEPLSNPRGARYIARWAPSSHELQKSERALHEYIGLAVLKLTSWRRRA